VLPYLRFLPVKKRSFLVQEKNMPILMRVLMAFLLGMPFFCSPSARAAENHISGDFGMQLGEVFKPGESPPGPVFEGFPLYPFQPAKENPALREYFVQMTPVSHRIFRIRATGPAANPAACSRQQDQLLEALKDNLKTPKMETVEAPDFTIKVLTEGTRNVTVKCSALSGGSLEIQYTDNELKDMAETEKIGQESH
jgi:hypothetical protein